MVRYPDGGKGESFSGYHTPDSTRNALYLYDTMYKQQAWYTRTCTRADTTVIGDMEQGDSPECYAQIFREIDSR